MTLISIVIPFYNTPIDILKRCINPFITHTYRDIEIVLVNDCSTQRYGHSLTQLIKSAQTPITFIDTPHNGGQNFARNAGIAASNGTYIAFLDSDDYLNMNEFEKVLDVVRLQQSQLYCFDAVAVDTNGKCLYTEELTQQIKGPEPLKQSIRKAAALWHWVVDANLIKNATLNTELRIGEDLVSIIPILAKSTTIVAINASPYQYVQHSSSMMKQANPQDRAALIDGFDMMLKDHGAELALYHDEVEWQAIWHLLFWEPLQILQQSNDASEYYKRARTWIDSAFPHWHQNPYLRTDPLARDLRFRLISRGHYTMYNIFHSITSRIHTTQL